MGIVLVSILVIEFAWMLISVFVAAAVLLGSLYYLILAAMRLVGASLELPPLLEVDENPHPDYLNCGDVAGECFREEDCAICLERLMEGSGREVARSSNCEHVFHTKCLMKWISTSRSCPICRRHVVSAYGF